MIKRLFIILLIVASCNAQILHDRDIYDIEHRKYHRSVVDIMISTGTAEGQLLYWDINLFGIDRWRNSDVTKLKWNDATNTLLVDTLNLNNPLDISTYTNLVAGTNITLVGDTLNVDDAFLINDGDDTTTGTLTAGGFTTAGTTDTGLLIVDTHTPGSSGAAGTEGTITYDSDYIYMCIAANSWKRVAIAAWGVAGENMVYEDGDNMVYEDGNNMIYD